MAESIKWTKEKVEEMAKWQKENGKSAKDAADHFGVPKQKYSAARVRYGVTDKTRFSKAENKPAKRPKAIELEVEPVTHNPMVALMFLPLETAKQFLRS